MSQRTERKEEHLALAKMFFNKQKYNSFDKMHLLRPTLPESKVNLDNIHVELFNKKLEAPFFINAMTGGSKKSLIINKKLGQVAQKTKIALSLGSASILAAENDQFESFYTARQENPDGVVIANVNPSTPAKITQKIVNDLQADALQIHLNSVQEAAMPEGERNFLWLENMKEIREKVSQPIIIKEVGFGFDAKSIQILKKAGFNLFDVAGSGGTNFAQIENNRNKQDVSYLEDLGLPTVITSLIANKENVDFFVSGGIRNPLDILKALSLGGRMVGIANTFLQELNKNDIAGLIKLIENWKEELAILLALYGKEKITDLIKIKKYYDLPLINDIEQII